MFGVLLNRRFARGEASAQDVSLNPPAVVVVVAVFMVCAVSIAMVVLYHCLGLYAGTSSLLEGFVESRV